MNWGFVERLEGLIGMGLHLCHYLPELTPYGDPLPFPVALFLDDLEDPYAAKDRPSLYTCRRMAQGRCPRQASEEKARRRTLALTSASNDECCA